MPSPGVLHPDKNVRQLFKALLFLMISGIVSGVVESEINVDLVLRRLDSNPKCVLTASA